MFVAPSPSNPKIMCVCPQYNLQLILFITLAGCSWFDVWWFVLFFLLSDSCVLCSGCLSTLQGMPSNVHSRSQEKWRDLVPKEDYTFLWLLVKCMSFFQEQQGYWGRPSSAWDSCFLSKRAKRTLVKIFHVLNQDLMGFDIIVLWSTFNNHSLWIKW